MSEPYDEQVEFALIHGIPVEEHLADPLQLALTQHYNGTRAIEHVVAISQERKAWLIRKTAEENLRQANEFWEEACTRVRITSPEN